MTKWEKMCPVEEIPAGGRKVVPANSLDILIFNTGKRWYACANECPHLGEPLDTGELQGHVVRCNAHGYKMDLSTGNCVTEAGLGVPIFPIEVRDGWVWVKI